MGKRSAKVLAFDSKLLKGGGITMQIRQITTLDHKNSATQHLDRKSGKNA